MIKFKQLFEAYEKEMNPKEVNHLKALHKELTSHYMHIDSKKSKYTQKDIDALHNYTNGSTINFHLWNLHENPKHVSQNSLSRNDTIPSLDKALDKVKTPRAFHVYSNTKINPTEKMDSKGIVHHPAYISTSINNRFPRHWWEIKRIGIGSNQINRRHILKIRVPEGHSGCYVGDHISTCPDQHEFILPRGLNLKYKGTKILKDLNYRHEAQEHHIHEMEIV